MLFLKEMERNNSPEEFIRFLSSFWKPGISKNAKRFKNPGGGEWRKEEEERASSRSYLKTMLVMSIFALN